jgi:hypothetical protein
MTTLGKRIALARAAIREKLAARERAREPLVSIEVQGKKTISETIAKMEAKGYVLDGAETNATGPVLLRFRAGDHRAAP